MGNQTVLSSDLVAQSHTREHFKEHVFDAMHVQDIRNFIPKCIVIAINIKMMNIYNFFFPFSSGDQQMF